MPETRYPDDHVRQMVADHARRQEAIREVEASERKFEDHARRLVVKYQAAAESRGHDHLCYQYDKFGLLYGIFDEDCAACWREHHDKQERRAEQAERGRKEERYGLVGAVVLVAIIFVLGAVFHFPPPPA